ncbi:hypothetical protein HK405_007243 [Cladochytrium tenue]|nr:hypothetical protein HK405_007243 [Cladochytrium tenue]
MAPTTVVIVGAGITGCAAAFYLARLGAGSHHCIVIDTAHSGPASQASGKAGGFLARGWVHAPQAHRDLADRGFDLHLDIARSLDGARTYGYRAVTTHSVELRPRESTIAVTPRPPLSSSPLSARRPTEPLHKARPPLLPQWVLPDNNESGAIDVAAKTIGTTATTAQCDPRRLTRALLDAAAPHAEFLHARAIGVDVAPAATAGPNQQGVSRAVAVKVLLPDGRTDSIHADHVVLAMGPWARDAAAEWGLPVPPVSAIRAHSVVFHANERAGPADGGGESGAAEPAFATSADCLFCDATALLRERRRRQPAGAAQATTTMLGPPVAGSWDDVDLPAEWEVYPRPDGSLYVCGVSDVYDVPSSGSSEAVRDFEIEVATAATAKVSAAAKACIPGVAAAEPAVSLQACCLPTCRDGMPILGPVDGFQNLWLATANDCWGILLGPATGEAIAELIIKGEGATTVDVRPFYPSRFKGGDD